MKRLAILVLGALFAICGAKGSYEHSVLFDLQGVAIEVRELNIQSDSFFLEAGEVESRAFGALKDLEVRVLSDIELDVMPGQPYLEISIDVAHAQGPSHVYVLEVELREMARLERPKDSVVTMAVPTWERKTLGVANRPEAILGMMERLLRSFSDEMREANYAD
ncbi:MAG: hypothetical protein AAGB46_10055 [Verrucomicrobiota bacterium]